MNDGKYRKTLPAGAYYDPLNHRRELQSIWYRQWLCIGRADDWMDPGEFRRVRVGAEQVIITLAEDRSLHAFHNTCRHRGSQLCAADSGTFSNGRIVCPYHAWSYSLKGELRHAPRTTPSDSIELQDFPLYPVALEVWRGFVFINLDPANRTLEQALGAEADNLAAWPLEDLRRVHQEKHCLAANWKIFWENYLECYHCPGVHPDLCQLVPIYREGWFDYRDARPETARESPLNPVADQLHTMLRPGAVTWSDDGTTELPWFRDLGERERAAGMTFSTFVPTMFLVAHVDYVRTVRVLPVGPQETELNVDWYVHRDVVGHPKLEVERLTNFGSRVVREDARVCELNQQGILCGWHEHGVLLERENHVFEFQQWVRRCLGEPGG